MKQIPIVPSSTSPSPASRVKTGISGPVTAGILIMVLALGGFGTWAALASLSSAAIALGVVAVEGNRKTVQHLEGGIIDEILVEEGSEVDAGQVLVRLDDTRPQASYQLLRGQYRAAIAREARLISERDGLKSIHFPEELLGASKDLEVSEIVKGQDGLFETRRTSRHGQVDILKQRISQVRKEIGGLTAQRKAKEEQVLLIREEIVGVVRPDELPSAAAYLLRKPF